MIYDNNNTSKAGRMEYWWPRVLSSDVLAVFLNCEIDEVKPSKLDILSSLVVIVADVLDWSILKYDITVFCG